MIIQRIEMSLEPALDTSLVPNHVKFYAFLPFDLSNVVLVSQRICMVHNYCFFLQNILCMSQETYL